MIFITDFHASMGLYYNIKIFRGEVVAYIQKDTMHIGILSKDMPNAKLWTELWVKKIGML